MSRTHGAGGGSEAKARDSTCLRTLDKSTTYQDTTTVANPSPVSHARSQIYQTTHIYIYICKHATIIYIYIYIYMYVCIWLCMIYIYMYMYIYIYMHTFCHKSLHHVVQCFRLSRYKKVGPSMPLQVALQDRHPSQGWKAPKGSQHPVAFSAVVATHRIHGAGILMLTLGVYWW